MSVVGQQRTLAVTARSNVTLPWLPSCDPHHNLRSIECLSSRATRRYFFPWRAWLFRWRPYGSTSSDPFNAVAAYVPEERTQDSEDIDGRTRPEDLRGSGGSGFATLGT